MENCDVNSPCFVYSIINCYAYRQLFGVVAMCWPCCCRQTYVEASPTKVFEECALNCASMPYWNPTVLEYRVQC